LGASFEIVETCLLVLRQGNILLDKKADQEMKMIFEQQQPNTQATASDQTLAE
jgi:hypothetical protein